MKKDDLHEIIEALTVSWHIKTIMHCLVDAEIVTSWTCQADVCICDTSDLDRTTFKMDGSRRSKTHPQVDHIVPRVENGSDRLENLRLVHYVCNVSRAFKGKQRPQSNRDALTAAKARARAIPAECPHCDWAGNELGLPSHWRQKHPESYLLTSRWARSTVLSVPNKGESK